MSLLAVWALLFVMYGLGLSYDKGDRSAGCLLLVIILAVVAGLLMYG